MRSGTCYHGGCCVVYACHGTCLKTQSRTFEKTNTSRRACTQTRIEVKTSSEVNDITARQGHTLNWYFWGVTEEGVSVVVSVCRCVVVLLCFIVELCCC
jgi:hypothetical protein